jgi:hypothetical protein
LVSAGTLVAGFPEHWAQVTKTRAQREDAHQQRKRLIRVRRVAREARFGHLQPVAQWVPDEPALENASEGLVSDGEVSAQLVHYPHVVPLAEFVSNTIDRICTVAMALASVRSRLGPGEESQRLASAIAELDLLIPAIRALAAFDEDTPPSKAV